MKFTFTLLLLAGTVAAPIQAPTQGTITSAHTEQAPLVPCSLGGAPCPGYEGWKPQVGHCYKVTAVETLQEIACPAESSGTFTWKPLENVPFDVRPKEWDGPETVASELARQSHGDASCGMAPGCNDKIHHRTCEDKTRFLLRSEDGKPHCLALGAKP